MDWTRIKRKKGSASRPSGPYTNLDELIRLQFSVADFSLKPQQPVTSILSGRYASKLRGRGLDFEELRRYLPGDDTRTMDWKVTARTRIPHVWVYTEEKDRQVVLLVDQRTNMFFGTKDRFKSVTAAELAAIASWRAVDSGDRIGAVIFNDSEIVQIEPRRSKNTVMSILGNLVRMNHMLRADGDTPSNPSMLSQAMDSVLQVVKKDVLFILISDCLGFDAKTRKQITQVAAHNDVICLLVSDPTRFSLVPQRLALSDGRLQMEVDFGDDKLRNRLLDNYKTEQQQLSQFFRKLSAPFLLISNEGTVAGQLRRLLGVRSPG